MDDGKIGTTGADEPGAGDAEIVARSHVDEILEKGRGLEPGIEGGLGRGGGLMAMRAVHIEVGAGTPLEGGGAVVLPF